METTVIWLKNLGHRLALEVPRLGRALSFTLAIVALVFAANAAIRYFVFILDAESKIVANSSIFIDGAPSFHSAPYLDERIRNEYQVGSNSGFFHRDRVQMARPDADGHQFSSNSPISATVEELRSLNLRSADLLAAYRHENLWRLLLHLHSLSRADDEFEAIRAWSSRMRRIESNTLVAQDEADRQAEDISTIRGRSIVGLLWYTERLYQRFIPTLIETRDCDGLSQIATSIWNRTVVLDTHPGEVDGVTLRRINANLILGAVFEDPRLCEHRPDALDALYLLGWSISDASKATEIETFERVGHAGKIGAYRRAVLAMTKSSWAEAADLASAIYATRPASRINELARLLEVRAIFWNFDRPPERLTPFSPIRNIDDQHAAALAIEELAKGMRIPSFASDARHYARLLRAQMNEAPDR